MILGFKKEFKPLIVAGIKIHTIRDDKNNRWAPGKAIHFTTGVRTKLMNVFDVRTCVSVQKIEFKWKQHNKGLVSESWGVQVFIDDRDVTNEGDIVDELVKGDGFEDRKAFFEWPGWYKTNFRGKLIHWTDKKY